MGPLLSLISLIAPGMLSDPMTKPEWIENLRDERKRVFVFERAAIAALFPEWPLDHHVQRFCETHGLSYRVVKGRYLFTRGLPQWIVEDMTGRMERGESLTLGIAMAQGVGDRASDQGCLTG